MEQFFKVLKIDETTIEVNAYKAKKQGQGEERASEELSKLLSVELKMVALDVDKFNNLD